MKHPSDVRALIKQITRLLNKKSNSTLGFIAAILSVALLALLLISDSRQLVRPLQGSYDNISDSIKASQLNGPFLVERVVDGDTIIIDKHGRSETIRLIGIDTPEITGPYTKVECFGPEASQFVATLLANNYIYTETDDTQANRDRYGRLLRYIYLDEKKQLNYELVNEGFAFEYTYRTPYRYQQSYYDAQTAAMEAKRGLWSPETCGGKTKQEITISQVQNISLPNGCYHVAQAGEHVGSNACLVGMVDHVFTSRQNNQFINFCSIYKHCPFSSVIFAENTDKIDLSEVEAGVVVSIQGYISQYRGQPQIIIESNQQIDIQ